MAKKKDIKEKEEETPENEEEEEEEEKWTGPRWVGDTPPRK